MDVGQFGLAFGGFLAIVGIIFFLALFYGAFFLHLATKMMGFEYQGFGRAFLTHLCILVLSSTITSLVTAFTGPGGAVGFLVSSIVSIFLISGIYGEDFVKSLCCYIISFILELIVTVILVFGLVFIGMTVFAVSAA